MKYVSASLSQSLRRSLSVVIVGVMVGSVSAQSALDQLSQQVRARYALNYERAIATAAINGMPTELHPTPHSTIKLIGLSGNKFLYQATEGLDQTKTISGDKVWPGGSLGLDLTGAPLLLGEWDDGNPSHAEFDNRIQIGEQTGAASHGNFVASCMIASGVNPACKAVAYAAQILSFDAFNNSDVPEMSAAAQNGLRISNHSYGLITGWIFGALGDGKWVWLGDPAINATTDSRMGFYEQGAADYDNLAFNAPFYLPVFSAGNQRGEGPSSQPVDHWVWQNNQWTSSNAVRDLDGGTLGYDCLGPEKTTKNCLIVGAVEENAAGYQGPTSVRMSSFSCWGPTDDGRIKPDLVTPGVDIFGTFGGGYSLGSGTSFASPVAAAGVGMMLQRYLQVHSATPLASTLHALAIHTCDEAGTTDGPDYAFGWGQMNVAKAVDLVSQSAFNPNIIMERTLQSGQTLDIPMVIADGSPLKVTICWHEPAGPILPDALNNRTSVLKNDLDLRLVDPNGATQLPWKLDPDNPTAAATRGDNRADNVEQVWIPSAVGGAYTLRISHKGATLVPAGSQVVSIIVSAQTSAGLKSLTLDPTTVVGGLQSSTGTVALLATKNSDTVLQLSSNNSAAIVPGTITIPAGALAASFPITTRPVQGTTNVTILAGGTVGTASATLTVRPVGLATPLDLWPGRIAGGNYVTGYVRLNGPAPVGGASVYLTSTDPAYAEPTRNWVVVPEGQTFYRFSVATSPVSQNRVVYIRASRAGVTIQNDITLLPAALIGFTSNISTVKGGNTVTGTVRIDAPAPPNGAIIRLSSNNSSLVQVPSTVVIPAGYRTVNFNITTRPTSSGSTVVLSAIRGSVTLTKGINVTP